MCTYEFHKLRASFMCTELAAEGRCGGDAVLFRYAAHHHAKVLRLYYNGYTQRVERFLYSIQYLVRHALLHLKAAREALYHMRYFAKARYPAIRYVGNVRLTEEGQHMVLAHRVELYVFYDHHLAIRFMKLGRQEYIVRVHAVALRDVLHRLRCPFRRFQQALAIGVFA